MPMGSDVDTGDDATGSVVDGFRECSKRVQEQQEQYDMQLKNATSMLKKQLTAAMQSTPLGGGAGSTLSSLDWTKYYQQLAPPVPASTVPIRERLASQRKRAEAELIRLNKLQDLVDSLPADMTDADLQALVNL